MFMYHMYIFMYVREIKYEITFFYYKYKYLVISKYPVIRHTFFAEKISFSCKNSENQDQNQLLSLYIWYI